MASPSSRLDTHYATLQESTIKEFKLLNLSIFPVRYNDEFYRNALKCDLNRLVYYKEKLIGGVSCQRNRYDTSNYRYSVYITTLGVLAGYRRSGIGTQLLQHILQLCCADPFVDYIYLHVQVDNQIAINFYQQFGFSIVKRIANYYKRIDPPDSYILQKTIDRRNEEVLLTNT